MAANSNPSPGVFDIAQPGKGQAASATSRPVIITNRPVMSDPMVNQVPQAEPTTAPPLKPTKKVVIAPLHHDVVAPKPVVIPPVAAETKPEPTAEHPAGVPAEKREDKQLTADQAQTAEQLAKERAAHVDEMIEKEQYFLPINAVQARRSRQVAIIGLLVIIVLALAWYNIALDAGLLPNTYNLPHTSLFTVK